MVVIDYGFKAVSESIQNIPSGVTQIINPDEIYDFQTSYEPTTGQYTLNTTPATALSFKFTGFIYHTRFLDGREPTEVTLDIRKNGTVIASQVHTLKTGFYSGDRANFLVATPPNEKYTNGDVISVHATANNNNVFFNSRTFEARQASLAPVAVNNSKPVTASFFFSNSIDLTILTASAQFAPILGNTTQIDIANSGFDSVLDIVSFNVGDQLRFENDESKVFTINRIISSSTQTTNKETYLLLDRPMIPGTNINYFLQRRFVNDPTNIIVQGIKAAGGTGPGSIRPKYVESELEDNMSLIIQKLSRENNI
jgi:hypothetical protein